MSRIGKLPVSIPAGVTITVDESNVVTVKGPKGELSQQISKDMILEQDNGVLTVKRPSDDKRHRALHGLTRSLIHNMVVGTTTGFSKNLEIVGVGYRAQMQGEKLVLNVGYSHPVEFEKIDGIKFETPDEDHRQRHRQAEGRTDRSRYPCGAFAGALQGQGYSL